MEPPVTAVYDANILYRAPLRDLFIRLAQAGLVRAKWTETIHDEWLRNVLKNNPQLSPDRLARTRNLMNEAVRDCLVTGYEDLIDSLTLPDPDDRHVLTWLPVLSVPPSSGSGRISATHPGPWRNCSPRLKATA
jgi:hypothetical protein